VFPSLAKRGVGEIFGKVFGGEFQSNIKSPLPPLRKGETIKSPSIPIFQRGRKLLFHTSLKMQEGYHIYVTF